MARTHDPSLSGAHVFAVSRSKRGAQEFLFASVSRGTAALRLHSLSILDELDRVGRSKVVESWATWKRVTQRPHVASRSGAPEKARRWGETVLGFVLPPAAAAFPFAPAADRAPAPVSESPRVSVMQSGETALVFELPKARLPFGASQESLRGGRLDHAFYGRPTGGHSRRDPAARCRTDAPRRLAGVLPRVASGASARN